MMKLILILYFVGTFVTTNQNETPPSNSNSNQSPQSEDMNNKIRQIARGIVDKWVAEGLTITRDKVEGWIGKIDEANEKDKKEQAVKVAKINTEQNIINDNKVNNLGDNFEDVKKTLVNTFNKIGQVKCENCKKSETTATTHDHINESPIEAKANAANKIDDLENLSAEELIKKQEQIKQFLRKEKIDKLANVAKHFSEIGQFKDIVDLANTVKTLSKSTAKEEL